MKVIIKLVIALHSFIIPLMSFGQVTNDLNKALKGDYVSNNNADEFLGTWQSMDGNYTFDLSKKIVQVKGGSFNFKTDKLIFKLTDVKLKDQKNEKVLNQPIQLTISTAYANTIYQDPVTNNLLDVYVYFRSKDAIELVVTTNLTGDKSKGSYFPERLMFKRVVK